MPLNHAEAVLSLRDDPALLTLDRDSLSLEVATLLGDDDPLSIALVIEEAKAAGPTVAARPAIMGGEECRLEKSCGGREPIAGNGRCMTCGAQRGTPEPLQSNTEAPQASPRAVEPAPATPALAKPAEGVLPAVAPRSDLPLTARLKEALGLTDADLGRLIGVARPTASAYVTGRLTEIVDGVRAEYMLRAVQKRREVLRELAGELQTIVAVSD
jgi:hypothetical protein